MLNKSTGCRDKNIRAAGQPLGLCIDRLATDHQGNAQISAEPAQVLDDLHQVGVRAALDHAELEAGQVDARDPDRVAQERGRGQLHGGRRQPRL